MKNLGKIFEENWKKSVPNNVFFYRFRDSGSSYYGGNENLRFSISNIADCLLYDFPTGLRLIELKNHKGKSIPISCILGQKKANGKYSKEKQIKDLYEANNYTGVYSHIIVFFSDVERCFDLPIDKFVSFLHNKERESIPISYFQENGTEIETFKLRSNYRFNIEKWLICIQNIKKTRNI